ncbi:TetR/AcrR family transcriptional regulator [Nocardia sp. NBC_01377]|uniref:TetR family transcriptional regulator n=1 Tax=Nocardia sp. NBC_01377 TaxID=2903595 RepID=UPI0032467D28
MNRESLRDRKRLRTRQKLIGSALDLFTERGFEEVTLDEICDEVDISTRTFSRYFSGKEEVAIAPLRDMWFAFLDNLTRRRPAPGALLQILQEDLLHAIEQMPAGDWEKRMGKCWRVADATPAVRANALLLCDQIPREVLVHLRSRFELGNLNEPYPIFALDILVSVVRCAFDRWIAHTGEPDKTDLEAQFRTVAAAVPSSLNLPLAIRPSGHD